MTIKLDWSYDQTHGCDIAFHNGYMIKAEHDSDAFNPFEDWDYNWPIMVQTPSHGYGHDIRRFENNSTYPLDEPLKRFSDQLVVHNQIALTGLANYTVPALMEAYSTAEPVKYCRDADELRDVLGQAYADLKESEQFDLYVELYGLLGIAALCGESCGYCQGDWARILVVAAPEAIAKFGSTDVTPESLQGTIDLYSAWARGDVYGYTLHAPTYDADGEVEEWTELDDSCWGYYGADHAESGLEEAALDALPEEPVRVPDMQKEDV